MFLQVVRLRWHVEGLIAPTNVISSTQAALAPLTIQHVTQPLKVFREVLPLGYDKETDEVKDSCRVRMLVVNDAQSEASVLNFH